MFVVVLQRFVSSLPGEISDGRADLCRPPSNSTHVDKCRLDILVVQGQQRLSADLDPRELGLLIARGRVFSVSYKS